MARDQSGEALESLVAHITRRYWRIQRIVHANELGKWRKPHTVTRKDKLRVGHRWRSGNELENSSQTVLSPPPRKHCRRSDGLAGNSEEAVWAGEMFGVLPQMLLRWWETSCVETLPTTVGGAPLRASDIWVADVRGAGNMSAITKFQRCFSAWLGSFPGYPYFAFTPPLKE